LLLIGGSDFGAAFLMIDASQFKVCTGACYSVRIILILLEE